MPFTRAGRRPAGRAASDHRGYLAGRYRNGAYSDDWTDVARCAEGTFVSYTATCRCGWRGPVRSADVVGADACRGDLREHHRDRVGGPRRPLQVGRA